MIEIAEKVDGTTKIFTAVKIHKHVSIADNNQDRATVARPGDYLVLDSYWNVVVLDRQTFKKVFGHKRMELLDE